MRDLEQAVGRDPLARPLRRALWDDANLLHLAQVEAEALAVADLGHANLVKEGDEALVIKARDLEDVLVARILHRIQVLAEPRVPEKALSLHRADRLERHRRRRVAEREQGASVAGGGHSGGLASDSSRLEHDGHALDSRAAGLLRRGAQAHLLVAGRLHVEGVLVGERVIAGDGVHLGAERVPVVRRAVRDERPVGDQARQRRDAQLHFAADGVVNESERALGSGARAKVDEHPSRAAQALDASHDRRHDHTGRLCNTLERQPGARKCCAGSARAP